MSHDSSSIATIRNGNFGVKAYSFFNHSKSVIDFPDAYANIWNKTQGNSNHRRIKALLVDYTKENCLFGSFIGRVISGHWNRHHVSAVSKIIANMSVKNYYDSADDIVSDLKTLKPEEGGSLYLRIKFIEKKLEDQLKYDFKF